MDTELILKTHEAATYYAAMCLVNSMGGTLLIANEDDAHIVSQNASGRVLIDHCPETGPHRLESYPTSVDFATAYGVRA